MNSQIVLKIIEEDRRTLYSISKRLELIADAIRFDWEKEKFENKIREMKA